jgi:hypothetical protein
MVRKKRKKQALGAMPVKDSEVGIPIVGIRGADALAIALMLQELRECSGFERQVKLVQKFKGTLKVCQTAFFFCVGGCVGDVRYVKMHV